MSSKIICGPCGYEDNIKHAKKWCTNCEEGFCEDCEKVHRSTKMSRNHTLISVSDYQKIKGVTISQTCVGHGKRYDLYCSVHDKPLCIDCVDQHKSCSQLVSLDTVAANAKQSTALADLDDTINGALQNVGKFIKNQETKDKEFDKQESLIRNAIQNTRKNLNQHLDLLEHKMMKDLSTKFINCKSAYAKVLRQLNLADTKLSQLKEEMETMKRMASDIQIFLGTREINRTVSVEITSIKGIINRTKYFEINMEIDSSVTSLLDCENNLGIISVVERNSESEFKEVKLCQAQKQICIPTRKSNRVIDLQLKQKFRISRPEDELHVSGCLLLPNGNILIADFFRENRIMEYHGQGQFIRFISCSGDPYYLTLIDADHIAITYVYKSNIEIINLSNAQVQTITPSHIYRAISYTDGKLYVIKASIGIVVLNLSGKTLYTFELDTDHISNITASKERLYYTHEQNNTIHCLNLTGQELWVYQNESIICPRDVATAYNMDVLVVGQTSNNLSFINENGLESKILLDRTKGLNEPRSISYNKDRKELLICNECNGNAAVYHVILG